MDTWEIRGAKWVNTSQAAAYLHISTRTVRRMCEDSRLSAEFHRLLGFWCVDSESLIAYKEQLDGGQPKPDQVPHVATPIGAVVSPRLPAQVNQVNQVAQVAQVAQVNQVNQVNQVEPIGAVVSPRLPAPAPVHVVAQPRPPAPAPMAIVAQPRPPAPAPMAIVAQPRPPAPARPPVESPSRPPATAPARPPAIAPSRPPALFGGGFKLMLVTFLAVAIPGLCFLIPFAVLVFR